MEEFKPKKEYKQYPIEALREAFGLYESWNFIEDKEEKEKLKKEFDELVKQYPGIDNRAKWYCEIEDEAYLYYKGLLKSPQKEFFEESLNGDKFLKEIIDNFKKDEETKEMKEIISGKIEENKLENVVNKYIDDPVKLKKLEFLKTLNEVNKNFEENKSKNKKSNK